MSIKLSASALIALGLSRSDAAALQTLLARAGSSDSSPTVAGNSTSIAGLASTVSRLANSVDELRADLDSIRNLSDLRARIAQLEDKTA